ncbi:MAG: chalcone isomerase family protein [Planctomycetota bacterium]
MLLATLLAVPLFSAPPAALPQGAVQEAKESESGHRYPVTLESTLRQADLPVADASGAKDAGAAAGRAPVEPRTLDLLGLGIREKTILAVNVYSYALYVDRPFVQKDLGDWRGWKRGKIERDEALFERLLEQNATKELRLRFCRNVAAEDVVDAFEKSIKPRMLARRRDKPGSDADKLKDVATFRGFFRLDKLRKGNELRFTWHPDGTLSTVVNGERKADLNSPDLCWALFDVYLGKKPISKSSKRKLVRRLPDVLAR